MTVISDNALAYRLGRALGGILCPSGRWGASPHCSSFSVLPAAQDIRALRDAMAEVIGQPADWVNDKFEDATDLWAERCGEGDDSVRLVGWVLCKASGYEYHHCRPIAATDLLARLVDIELQVWAAGCGHVWGLGVLDLAPLVRQIYDPADVGAVAEAVSAAAAQLATYVFDDPRYAVQIERGRRRLKQSILTLNGGSYEPPAAARLAVLDPVDGAIRALVEEAWPRLQDACHTAAWPFVRTGFYLRCLLERGTMPVEPECCFPERTVCDTGSDPLRRTYGLVAAVHALAQETLGEVLSHDTGLASSDRLPADLWDGADTDAAWLDRADKVWRWAADQRSSIQEGLGVPPLAHPLPEARRAKEFDEADLKLAFARALARLVSDGRPFVDVDFRLDEENSVSVNGRTVHFTRATEYEILLIHAEKAKLQYRAGASSEYCGYMTVQEAAQWNLTSELVASEIQKRWKGIAGAIRAAGVDWEPFERRDKHKKRGGPRRINCHPAAIRLPPED
jgi:hypothetical protein